MSMLMTIRGDSEVPGSSLIPNCKNLYNIYHPYDPIVSKVDALVTFRGHTGLSLGLMNSSAMLNLLLSSILAIPLAFERIPLT